MPNINTISIKNGFFSHLTENIAIRKKIEYKNPLFVKYKITWKRHLVLERLYTL